MTHNIYNTRIITAERAGFEIYCDTAKTNGIPGTILTNTRPDSPYNGECLDIFDDGTFDHYSQFKGQELKFKFTPIA